MPDGRALVSVHRETVRLPRSPLPDETAKRLPVGHSCEELPGNAASRRETEP
jgi:hypothetical protein